MIRVAECGDQGSRCLLSRPDPATSGRLQDSGGDSGSVVILASVRWIQADRLPNFEPS